jgi:hypothetical protein
MPACDSPGDPNREAQRPAAPLVDAQASSANAVPTQVNPSFFQTPGV